LLEAAPDSVGVKAEPMPWWLDLLLLGAAVALWFSGSADPGDV